MENKKENSKKSLNDVIKKLNKTGLILIIIVYILFLSLILALLKPNNKYLSVPAYEHQFWNEEVSPQITIVGNRTVNDNNSVSLRYNITSSTIARNQDGNISNDPHYKLTSIQLSAGVVNKLSTYNEDNINSMYYFTELSSYTTPVTNSFTLDNSSKAQHPMTFYARLEYTVGKERRVASFKEPIKLLPTENEKSDMRSVYDSKYKIYPALAAPIKDNQDKKIGTVQFAANLNSDKNYEAGVRIKLDDKDNLKFHIDMQSWIVTEDGEYLPFIGVYNYANRRSNYSQSNRIIDRRLNPAYICCVVSYCVEENKGATQHDEIITTYDQKVCYMQAISSLSSSFDTVPPTEPEEIGETKPDVGDYGDERFKLTQTIQLVIGIGSGVLAVGIITVACIITVKMVQKNKHEEESSEKTEE